MKMEGGFVISNVPPGKVWRLTPTMDSLATRGIGADAVTFQTTSDGQTVNLGDIRLKTAHTLSVGTDTGLTATSSR
jgi:hypothetical protein